MEHHAVEHRKLIDDAAKVIVAEVAIVLTREQRPWALLAEFVTTTGRLDVD